MHCIREPIIADGLNSDRFLVRLGIENQSHIDSRLPHRFGAFKIRTLRCAARHLGVRASESANWLEKSMYVQAIEKRYRENATLLNEVVAPACGMLIGYLYRPKGKVVYQPYSKLVDAFRPTDIGFDTYRAYYSRMVLVSVVVVPGCLLLKLLVLLILYLTHRVQLLRCVPSPAVQAQLKKLNGDSLQSMDGLLFCASEERQYHQRLFIIRQRYLIILDVDCDEYDPHILRQFYTQSPFTVYAVASITKVVNNGFFIENRWGSAQVSFPIVTYDMDDGIASWLHRNMMSISKQYRQR